MQLREALNDIAEIRAQIERTETFRGLRSVAVSASSLLVFFGAIGCQFFPADGKVNRFIGTWGMVAILGLVVVVIEMWFRAVRSNSVSGKRLVWLAHRALIAHLAPSLFVGAVMTCVVIARQELAWMLPGVWAMIYSLGLISCRQHLPNIAQLASAYFILRGATSLFQMIYQGVDHFDPDVANWQMVVTFGLGQLLLAFLIYWKLERSNGEKEND